MMTTDLALIGRLGDGAVAAAALASSVFFISFTFEWAGLRGGAAGRAGVWRPQSAMVRRALRVGLWAALLISLPMIVLRCTASRSCWRWARLGHRAPRATLSDGPGVGITPALWFLAIRASWRASTGRSRDCGITLGAIPANAVLVYLLIHGAWGLPRLEPVRRRLGTRSSISGCFWRVFGSPGAAGRFKNIMCWAASGDRLDLMRQLSVIGAPISMSS